LVARTPGFATLKICGTSKRSSPIVTVRSLWNRLSLAALGAGLGILLLAALLFGLYAAGVIQGVGERSRDVGMITGFGSILETPPTPTAPVSTPISVSTPTPEPTPPSAPIDRLIIPSIGVDAPVVTLGIDANGAMESPGGPWEVAWYNFSARPGSKGNAVFSGHVDYHDVGPAVFWGIRDLKEGDEIQVLLADGTLYRYEVTALNSFEAGAAPVDEIVGPTPNEVVTLITCTGTFYSSSREYSHRLVARAERLPELPSGQAAAP
jgi:LPXTG-site transpeptidase (sortase) family protein